MTDNLQKIVEQTIAAITFRQGYLEITTNGGYLLLISNRTTIDLQPDDMLGDKPALISAVTRSPESIRIAIGQKSAIVIGYRRTDFRAPEAYVLSGPDGTWVGRDD